MTVLCAVVSAACFVYAYRDTLQWMLERYLNAESHYSHGFLIPFVSGYLVWRMRDRLRALPRSGSTWGLALVAVALLLHVASVFTHVYFTSGFSILLLLVGLIAYCLGWEFVRSNAFALGYLVFMFPLPLEVVGGISFWLKMLVAGWATAAMQLAGICIFREGAVLHLANTTLTVGDPCSGIRSLIALLALGALVTRFARIRLTRKIVLFLATIPIAVVCNLVRVCALIAAANAFGAEWAAPEHWFHTVSAVGVFGFSVVFLLVGAKALE